MFPYSVKLGAVKLLRQNIQGTLILKTSSVVTEVGLCDKDLYLWPPYIVIE